MPWIRQCELDAGQEDLPPIPTRIASNEEFIPPPQSAEQREVELRLWAIAETAAPMLGLSRRDFLRTSSGMAATLLAMNQVFGSSCEVDAAEISEPEKVREKWPKDEFIFDIQTHQVDGSLRVVTFGRGPTEAWHEAGRLINQRPEASNRILLCYEGYAPIDLIRDGQVDLLFDSHSDRPHPDSRSFPPGTLHLCATTQETNRWIPMTCERISSEIRARDDVPVLNAPQRTGTLAVELYGSERRQLLRAVGCPHQ